MRFNDKELRQHIKSVPVELEGNLTYFDFKDGRYLIFHGYMEYFVLSERFMIRSTSDDVAS